jgi:hypothetical protein
LMHQSSCMHEVLYGALYWEECSMVPDAGSFAFIPKCLRSNMNLADEFRVERSL